MNPFKSVVLHSPQTSQRIVVLGLLTCLTAAPMVPAQENEEPNLAGKQQSVAQRYARLEELLLRLADMEATDNPERAGLLKQVAKQSREKFVLNRLKGAGDAIRDGQLSKAIENQEAATNDLQSLLKLLLTEDRSKRIRDERKRIAELIKRLRLSERNERSVRARTENGVDLAEVLEQQEGVTDRTEKLRDELKDEDAEDSNEDEAGTEDRGSKQDQMKPSDPSDSNSDSESPSNNEGNAEQKPKSSDQPKQDAGEKSPQDAAMSESSQPKSGEPSQDGQPSAPEPPATPQQEAEKQVEEALRRMKQAEQKLADNNREEAVEEQKAAEAELQEAIDRLEKILRQLREEERGRELARLESRLKKMAAMQSSVLDQTQLLSQTPEKQRGRSTDLRSGELSFEEQKVTLESDRAMLLLREEGSSVAFPEILAQVRDDSVIVTQRLGKSQIDDVTQGIQADILAALEEMIAATIREQRELEKQKQQPPQQGGQSGGQGNQPLVKAIAELKLIRTMQTRIQTTTNRFAQQVDEDQISSTEALPLLKDLSRRQDRLYKITRDLVTKRNR
ncbi:MAG: hypothetical protein AAGD07_11465 [Planctomycetota bacterium]